MSKQRAALAFVLGVCFIIMAIAQLNNVIDASMIWRAIYATVYLILGFGLCIYASNFADK